MPRVRAYNPKYAEQDLAKDLKNYSKLDGWTLEDCNRVSGISLRTLSRRMKEPRNFSLEELASLVPVIGLDDLTLLVSQYLKQAQKTRPPAK